MYMFSANIRPEAVFPIYFNSWDSSLAVVILAVIIVSVIWTEICLLEFWSKFWHSSQLICREILPRTQKCQTCSWVIPLYTIYVMGQQRVWHLCKDQEKRHILKYLLCLVLLSLSCFWREHKNIFSYLRSYLSTLSLRIIRLNKWY